MILYQKNNSMRLFQWNGGIDWIKVLVKKKEVIPARMKKGEDDIASSTKMLRKRNNVLEFFQVNFKNFYDYYM